MTPAATINPAADFARYRALRREARADAPAAYQKVAREFEALFVQLMLKSAREASFGDGIFDSHQMRFYRDMFDSQIAAALADQGMLGFEKLLAPSIPGLAAQAHAEGELKLPPRREFPPSTATRSEATAVRSAQTPTTTTENVFTAAFVDDPKMTAFINAVQQPATRAAQRLGTTPEILIAQAALETGWGAHVMRDDYGRSSHNLFGIKANGAWHGATVERRTMEYLGGKPVKVRAAFRAYPDLGAAFDDYARFIQNNSRYQHALAKASDPHAYIHEIARAGYATDPQYADKILAIHDQLQAATRIALDKM